MEIWKMDFQTRLKSEKMIPYNSSSFSAWLDEHLQGVKTVKDNKRNIYFNVPAAFDIETSSFYIGSEKAACMYLWAFGLNGGCLYGRTWEEFTNLCNQLTDILALSDTKKLIIYVHNLAYEFAWIAKRFEWNNVFSLKMRKPVKAITNSGIEFRCSYLLSGYSLEKLGDELRRYKTAKAVGALDYSKIRHSKTPLTKQELYYQAQDVRVVMAYIMECIEDENNNISNIPLTKTGYVRRYCRNACLYAGSHHKQNTAYTKLIKSLTLTPEVYNMLKRAFAGGFTHANAFYSGKLKENVDSFDFTSSYPAMICAKLYPMSKAEKIEVDTRKALEENLNYYCCLFDIEFYNIRPKLYFDHPISKSKCFKAVGALEDNGRVVSAECIATTITEQDFFTIRDFYEWDSMRIGTFYRFYKSYLPTPFIKAVLKLYQDKTTLKGVEGKEIEYMRSKEMLNSCYGMAVTDIVRPEIEYIDGNWRETPTDLDTAINKYNKGKRRFLYYPWGV